MSVTYNKSSPAWLQTERALWSRKRGVERGADAAQHSSSGYVSACISAAQLCSSHASGTDRGGVGLSHGGAEPGWSLADVCRVQGGD